MIAVDSPAHLDTAIGQVATGDWFPIDQARPSVEAGTQGVRAGLTTTVELEGSPRPALVAETIALVVPEA